MIDYTTTTTDFSDPISICVSAPLGYGRGSENWKALETMVAGLAREGHSSKDILDITLPMIAEEWRLDLIQICVRKFNMKSQSEGAQTD